MAIPKKINEGNFYHLLQAALRMRSLQKDRSSSVTWAKIHDAEVVFDTLLEQILEDVDKVSTNRVIDKMNHIAST